LTPDEKLPGSERGAAAPPGASKQSDSAMMKMLRLNRVLNLETFVGDVINGMAPIIERGYLGLGLAGVAASG
jgi:hypothetical protein